MSDDRVDFAIALLVIVSMLYFGARVLEYAWHAHLTYQLQENSDGR